MMARKIGRRLLSLLLVFSLVIPMGIPAYAMEIPYVYLEGSRVSAEGNAVNFGITEQALGEKDTIYGIPIYREGDTTQAATVKIKTYDVSATYGKDYELMGEDIVVTPQDKTLLERTMTEDFSDENTEYVVDVPDSVLESLDEDEPSLEVQMTPGKSSLAALKESQSGIEARTTVLKEGNPLDGSAVSMTVLQSIVPQLMDSMGSSSEVTVSFAPGEDLKYLSLRIFDDSKSEGNESLNLSFSEAEGVEIGTANSVSITVEDNEPKEYSYFSFDSMVYYAENGSVDVVIHRTGAPYSMADMKLTTSGTTADCSEEVIFAPYEMKKTVSIDVSGDGQFSVALEEPKAAKLGSPSSAKVYMNKTEQLSRKSAARNNLSSESKEIDIEGTKLKVVFEGSKNYGKVYDTSFDPELEVGTFYRPGPKDAYDYSNPNQEILEEQYPVYWNYDKDDNLSGDKPWGCGYYDCYYKKDSDEGVLKYYHTSCWAEGSEKTEMSGIINPLYYQYFQPYWVQTQDHNNKYNESVFEMYTSNDNKLIKSSVVKGQFSKKLGTDATIRVDAGDSRYPIRNPVAFRILARDTYGGACAKINLYYGGLFCKYRQIRVRTELPSTLEYIDYQADGSKSKHYSVPANVNARCGAQVVTDTEARDVYVNTDSTKSQMVFSLGMVSLYNQANIYGQIKGYSIKHKAYNSATSGAAVTTYYPDDYRKEIDDSFGSVDNVISYSYMDRENLFAQIREDLGQISFDKYFVDFLDRREVMRTTSSDGKGFLYELTFKPDFEYIPVKVKVLPPYSDTEDSKCTGSFTNPMLSKYSQLTLHAGDRLDLSATADYPEYYRVTGYQISTDGGIKFDDIRSDVKLLLEPHKEYVIRPLLEPQDNYIELRLSDKAKEVLDLRNAITDNIDGAIRTVLNLNPFETTAEKQARPDVGEVYQIAAVQKRHIAPAGMEYRPVIKDVMTGEVYDTGLLYVTARDAKKNNLYEIDVELVNLSELSTFNITGNLQMEVDTIRSNGLEQAHVPLVNYSVTAGSVPENADSSSSLVVTGFTDENGDYKVENVRGKMGDKISILVSDGLRDNQIISVTLNGAADSGNTLVNAGSEILHYPASSPKVTSIEYRYAKELNNQKQGFLDNSVHLYQDTFYVNAFVDKKDREINRAIFTFVNSKGKRAEYPVLEKKGSAGQYELQVDDMLKKVDNGSRLYVRLEDKELIMEGSDSHITYPTVDTGLVFYVENEVIVPKYFEMNGTEANAVNMPVLGEIRGTTSSGKFGMSRVDYGDKVGYSLLVNLNALVFNNKPALNNTQKESMVTEFIGLAKETTENKKKWAGTVINETTKGKEEAAKTSEKPLKEQTKDYEKTANDAKETPNAFAANDKNKTTFSANVIVMLAYDFAYNSETDEYDMYQFAITIGGSFDVNKMFYTAVVYVPVFLNIYGYLQGSITVGSITAQKGDGITGSDFSRYAENVATYLEDNWEDYSLLFQLMPRVKGQIGAGICGVLSARGYLKFDFQFDIGSGMSKSGALMEGTGGIGFDILVGTIDFDLLTGRVGCGSLENSGEFLFFDGLAGDLLAVKGKDSRLLYKTSNQMLSYKDYDFGTSDMASFAPQKVRAQPGEVSRTVLLNNAAERTRPNIVDLKDGKKLITFLGAKKGEAEGSDYMCLYYSIFDGSSWSTPKPVSDDGTFDTTPTILKGENRVAIAWSNASRAFTSKDTEKDKLQCLGISMSILDLNTMKFSEQIDIVKDSYLNSNPQLTMAGSKVYCTYMKRDISEVTEIAQLTDIAGTYYTMAFKEYDMVTKEHTDELFVVTRNDANVSDPYVLSYDSQAASITATAADGSEGTADLLINAFVIDTDHLLDTPEDREVYLEIYDTNRNKKYFPIRITDNAVGDEQVQLTDIGGKVYMTWVEDGAKMMVYDVTELAEALYNQQLAGDRYINADAEDKNWYKAERFEIIITEELKEGSTTTTSTHDAYEGSVYDEIRQGIFRIASSNIRDSEDYQVSIHEYQLVTDGRDIYILYTAPCNDYDKDGVDLYGMRYSEAENLFTPSVQITDDEFVMDEFSAVMREDDTISLVCNYFTQTISEEVGMIFSPNTLVEIEFEPKGSLTIDGDRISIDDDLIVGETVPIKFAVKNEGLLTSKGYTVKVEYEKNGSKTTILEEDVDSQNVTAGSEYRPAENPVTGVKLGTLASGESAEFSVAWKVPKNAIGGKLVVTVTENGVTSNAAYKAEHEITGGSELVINDASATKEGGKIIYEADIYNKGNQASSLAKFKLYKTVSNDERVLIETIDIDGLESGEKTTIKTEYIIEEDDFNSYGVIALRGEVGEGEEPDSSFNSRVKYSEPAIMKINDDAETLYLKRNGRAKLDVTYLPWSSKEADIIYFSKDNSIATVDKNGQVKAEGRGETLIVAYMKGVGIKDVIKVNVDNSPSSGGGSAASPNEMKISDTENGARAEFNGTPIENGAEVTITSNQATELLKAVEGEEALEIIVDAKGAKADERFAVTIPKKLVEGLSKEKVKQLRIVSSAGTVMLKPDSLAAENGNQYRVEITKLQPEANGILQALEVDVLADGKSIKGELELSIPVSEDSIDRLMDKNNAIILVYPPDNQVKVINTAITGNEAVLKLPANSQAKLVESDKGFGITGDFKQIMPTLQQVRRNGEGVGCEIYNIDGYNYFKLRDISLLMKGLETEFSIAVGENQSILVNTDGIYESLGTELKPGTDNSKTCVKSEWTLTVDGYTYPVWCYNIGGYNYFQLRTLGIALGFDVGYDINTNCVDITAK